MKTIYEELDAAADRADCLTETTAESGDVLGALAITVTVWTHHEGDVLNRLVDKLRKAADAMEVSRP